jgi:pyruvate dehydrogenase E2 component (dihydrolipoamide acetyltransferase)
MAVEVTMPKLGLTMADGMLVRWLVEDGQAVSKGQPLFEVETDKATVEAEAPAEGVLRIAVEAGSVIPVMAVVGHILAPGEAPSKSMVLPDQGTLSLKQTRQSGPQAEFVSALQPSSGRVLASPAARRRARELSVDISQVQGSGEGGRIILADVEAFASSAEVQPSTQADQMVRASPLAKRIAREAGLDLTTIQGSGAASRITREDVERALAERQPISPSSYAPTSRQGETMPLTGVRSVIAERMLTSAHQTASVTITTTVDATELVNVRDQLNEGLSQKLGLRIAYNDVLIKIVARALKEFPYMNAHHEEGTMRLMPDVHIGLAIDTQRGLMVIVVPHANDKSIPDISREVQDKARRAIDGGILPDELSGSTFTLTNLGAFGVEAFTPIINPPEVAILGIGRIEQQPAAYKGEISLRHRMILSLTFDHRLIDGAPAARFLQRVRDLIEKPYLMLAND